MTDAQQALWAIPNTFGIYWWITSAVFAGFAAVTMFLYLIMNERLSHLLVSRVIIMFSLIGYMLTPLNSGWLPWAVMLASVGGLYATFLIATRWCERHNVAEQRPTAPYHAEQHASRPGQVLGNRSRHL